MSETIEQVVNPKIVGLPAISDHYLDPKSSYHFFDITNKNIIISKLKLQFIIKIKKIYLEILILINFILII